MGARTKKRTMTAKAFDVEIQHWVPRFLLKNFVDRDGRVFRLDVADDSLSKWPPKYAAARPNFNMLMAGGEPISFEPRFQKIETAAARAIGEIVAGRSLAALSLRGRHAIAVFIAAQSFRTEAYRKGLQASAGAVPMGVALERLWDSLPHLAAMVARRPWALMEAPGEAHFYLGDSPVVLQSTEHPGRAMEIGLDMTGIEAFLPLSPTLALYLPCRSVGRDIVNGYHAAIAMSAWPLARGALEARGETEAVRLAERAIAETGSLYRSLAQGTAFAADPENIENLNYLQCAWASSGVYSDRADFSFAKRVFSENPAYRDVMPVRLVTLWD